MEAIVTSYKTFSLEGTLKFEHIRFFLQNGFLHFNNFLSPVEVKNILASIIKVQKEWIQQAREKINGIPIIYGHDENNNRIVHRFPFTSLYSPILHKLVQDEKLKPLLKFIKQGRIAEDERDGVVVNQFINNKKSRMKQLGWHTDGLRDIFYLQKVKPMLNVGIYLTDSTKEHGGLRVLPGTHKQGIGGLLFRKLHFISNKPDKNEVAIVARAGDMVVHHGSLWHRVAYSKLMGAASRRIVMYIPIICGKCKPKTDKSWTPFYHKIRILPKK